MNFNALTKIPKIVSLTAAAEAEDQANSDFLLKANARFGEHGIHNAATHDLTIV